MNIIMDNDLEDNFLFGIFIMIYFRGKWRYFSIIIKHPINNPTWLYYRISISTKITGSMKKKKKKKLYT